VTPSFHVSYSGAVRADLKRLLEEAARHHPDFARAAIAAAKAIDARLRSAARDFGDRHFSLEELELDVRLAVVRPLAVIYAVHHRRPIVFVQRFTLLSAPPTTAS
jgi:hypothetical protein